MTKCNYFDDEYMAAPLVTADEITRRYGSPPSPDLDINQANVVNTVRRPNPVFNDNVAVELLGNLSDALHAAWNGWETACKYEDEERQEYYMKVIRLCDDTMKKIKKF